MLHVAVVQQTYADLILSGKKTMESRLARARIAPFGVIEPGAAIYFKIWAGGYACRAFACTIVEAVDLTPAEIEKYRAAFDKRIRADPDYWLVKDKSKFATFIGLERVERVSIGPDIAEARVRQPRAGWLVLPDDAPFQRDSRSA